MSSHFNRRALFALGFSAFALSACSGVIGPPDASQMYVIRPAVPQATTGPAVTWRVSVDLPDAPDYLDTNRIAIERGLTADFYAGAVWQERVPQGIRRAIVEALEDSGRVPIVSSGRDGLRSDYFLKTDIRDFTARYDNGEGAPLAVVRINAKLVSGFGAKTVSSITITREVRAMENSVPAATMALNQAAGAVLGELVNWAVATPAPAKD